MNYIDYTSERTKSGELEMRVKPLHNIHGAAPKSSKLAIVIYLAANVALALAIYFGLKMRGIV